MLKSQFLLAATFLVFGSSVVLAESANTGSQGSVSVEAFTEQESNIRQDKLDILASKYEALEARMEKLFSGSSQRQGSDLENPYDSHVVQTMQGWSSMDHLATARVNQEEANILKKKVQKLQSRIDRFSQKPYLDTKGFKRSGLEILKGNLTQDLREATQKTAWHQSQAKSVMISESKHQQRS